MVKDPLSKDKIVQGPYFQHIPQPIRQSILQNDWKHRYKVQQGFSVRDYSAPLIQLTVYIYTNQDEDPCLDILATFSFLLDRVPNKNVLKPKYDLYFYGTPFLKQFPEKKGELIDEIHANSGFTVNTVPVPIYVFREEEIRRVCIHELLHAFGFDGVHPQTGRSEAEGQECLDLLKPIHGQHLCDGNDGVRIYEALTETQATLLNVLFQKESIGVHSIKQEKDHVQRQIQEIQNHYGVSKENYTDYKQGVSKTISYFLFRGFLMNKLDRFIQKSLLSPSSTDYVKMIEEGIRGQQGLGKGRKTIKEVKKGVKRVRATKRRGLKMNYSA